MCGLGPLRSLSVESSEGSSDIAAAIIQGAPVSRRTAFLRGTPQRAFSLEELPVPKDSRKRHSLNLENANIAVSPGTEQISLQSSGGGADLQQTGGRTLVGDQQLSCNSPIEEGNEDGHELTPPMDHVDMSTPTLEAATASINMTTTSLDMALPSLDAASSTNGIFHHFFVAIKTLKFCKLQEVIHKSYVQINFNQHHSN